MLIHAVQQKTISLTFIYKSVCVQEEQSWRQGTGSQSDATSVAVV